MVQVGSLTYFVPDMADAVGDFEAATREYAQVDTWRNTSWTGKANHDPSLIGV